MIIDLDDVANVDFIRYLTSNPWFTSLWTLQEAYLCPEAMIMTKDARKALHMWNTEPSVARLNVRQIVMIFEFTYYYGTVLKSRSNITAATNWTRAGREQIIRAIEETGLLQLTNHPTSLLAMAQYRQTSPDNITDRIYGIMQVFGLRIEKSRPGARPDLELTLDQLEDELGAALMAKNPVMSQLHNYRTEPPLGKGWRLTKESQPAATFSSVYNKLGVGKLDSEEYHCLMFPCQMSTIEMDANLWAHFEGPTITLDRLYGCWKYRGSRDLHLAVDCTEPLKIDTDTDFDGGGDKRTFREVETIIKQNPKALVLLIGEHRPDTPKYAYSWGLSRFGLVITPYEVHGHMQHLIWRRRAICTWTLSDEKLARGTGIADQVKGRDWGHTVGILG